VHSGEIIDYRYAWRGSDGGLHQVLLSSEYTTMVTRAVKEQPVYSDYRKAAGDVVIYQDVAAGETRAGHGPRIVFLGCDYSDRTIKNYDERDRSGRRLEFTGCRAPDGLKYAFHRIRIEIHVPADAIVDTSKLTGATASPSVVARPSAASSPS
jgi:hypothetical protein